MQTFVLENARKTIRDLWREIDAGYAWPEKRPPEVKIPYADHPPIIDGIADEPAWANALTFRDEYPLGSQERNRTGALWHVMWDKEFLYAAAHFPQANPVSQPYDPARKTAPWKADALELFAGSRTARFRTYWEVVVAPDGSQYNSLCWNNRWNFYISLPEEEIAGLQTAGSLTPDGYCVEIALPWRELPAYLNGNAPQPGEQIDFILIRCRDGVQSSCLPILYGGHNVFGHLRGILQE